MLCIREEWLYIIRISLFKKRRSKAIVWVT